MQQAVAASIAISAEPRHLRVPSRSRRAGGRPMPMNEHEFHVACAILDDIRKLIAAGKSQRWDVIKWAVALNIALATASIALKQTVHPDVRWWLCAVAAVVAVLGLLLVWHYNCRMTNARNDSVKTEKYLMNNGIDWTAITGSAPRTHDCFYDKQELLIFPGVLLLSVVPTLLVAWIS